MHLIVITASAARPAPSDKTWIVRLTGAPQEDDAPPPGLLQLADEAARQVRETFPSWLWNWCRESGALELEVWPGPTSWWWYTPISEKSPLRSPVIREIYWLTLLRLMCKRLPLESLEWHGNDRLMEPIVAQIAREKHLPLRIQAYPSPWRRRLWVNGVGRLRYTVSHACRWAALRLLGYTNTLGTATFESAFFTLYPSLWEFVSDTGTPRMYGSLPDYMQQKGHDSFYPVAYQGPIADLFLDRARLLQRCRRNRILFIEGLLSLKDWWACHMTAGLFIRYTAWRRSQRSRPVFYAHLNVARLLWRELDANVLSYEIPFDRMMSRSFQHLRELHPSLRLLFHHFEYQPMERAVTSGVRLGGPTKVIGLQAGIFTSNQMGFTFPKEEAQSNGTRDLRAPIADYLAAYGELPYRHFSDRLTGQRVCWSGPLRYCKASPQEAFIRQRWLNVRGLPEDARYVTVTTSISRDESLVLLESAFRELAAEPGLFLLIKCHYHTPLAAEARQLARRYNTNRYRLFDSDLLSLLRISTAMLSAGSSTAMEAIAVGCMPIVYRPVGEMPCSPMLDVPESVAFWSTSESLKRALQSCLARDEADRHRRESWPQALKAQMSPNDGSANDRFYQFCRSANILS